MSDARLTTEYEEQELKDLRRREILLRNRCITRKSKPKVTK
jgi:hypothetical protein